MCQAWGAKLSRLSPFLQERALGSPESLKDPPYRQAHPGEVWAFPSCQHPLTEGSEHHPRDPFVLKCSCPQTSYFCPLCIEFWSHASHQDTTHSKGCLAPGATDPAKHRKCLSPLLVRDSGDTSLSRQLRWLLNCTVPWSSRLEVSSCLPMVVLQDFLLLLNALTLSYTNFILLPTGLCF